MTLYCVRAKVSGKSMLATRAGWVPVCAALFRADLVCSKSKGKAEGWAVGRGIKQSYEVVPVAWLPACKREPI